MYVLIGESLLHKDTCVLCYEKRENGESERNKNNNERYYFWVGIKDLFTERNKDEIENGFNLEKTLMVKMCIEINGEYKCKNYDRKLIDKLLEVKGIDNIRKFMRDNEVKVDDWLDGFDNGLNSGLDSKEDFWDFLENKGKNCEIYVKDKKDREIVLIDLDVIRIDSVRVFEC